MSADVRSAIKSVKLDSVVMVAHSLGATVGCLLLSGALTQTRQICASLVSAQVVACSTTETYAQSGHACSLLQALLLSALHVPATSCCVWTPGLLQSSGMLLFLLMSASS